MNFILQLFQNEEIVAIGFSVVLLGVFIGAWIYLYFEEIQCKKSIEGRTRKIWVRRWFSLGGCFAGIGIPMFLNILGITCYYNGEGNFGPCSDRSISERLALTLDMMGDACFIIFIVASFRIQRANLFFETVKPITPLIFGLIGAVILIVWGIHFFTRPYSDKSLYSISEDWKPLIGWVLVWFYFVFRD